MHLLPCGLAIFLQWKVEYPLTNALACFNMKSDAVLADFILILLFCSMRSLTVKKLMEFDTITNMWRYIQMVVETLQPCWIATQYRLVHFCTRYKQVIRMTLRFPSDTKRTNQVFDGI